MKVPIYGFEYIDPHPGGINEDGTCRTERCLDFVASPMPEQDLLREYIEHRRENEKKFRVWDIKVHSLGQVGMIDLEDEKINSSWAIERFLTFRK